MKLTLTVFPLLMCILAALPARADEHEDRDEDGDVREVEVLKGGRSQGGDDDDGPRGRGGPMGGMRRMMVSKERMSGHEPDPAMRAKHETMRAAQEKVRDIAMKLRKAKDADKPALKKEAKAAVGELFDARLAMEQAMVDRMSEKLADKKGKLDKKKAARERLIEEKVDKLAGDAPSWDD